MSPHTYTESEELADWIRAIGRWKSEQRRLKKLVSEIEHILQEREEMVDEALWMRATARTKEECTATDEVLSKAVAMANREHQRTMKKLVAIYEALKESHVEDLFERPEMMNGAAMDRRVEEAGRESFPASDPPSFNPGRA